MPLNTIAGRFYGYFVSVGRRSTVAVAKSVLGDLSSALTGERSSVDRLSL
jgi:hypothetical protein